MGKVGSARDVTESKRKSKCHGVTISASGRRGFASGSFSRSRECPGSRWQPSALPGRRFPNFPPLAPYFGRDDSSQRALQGVGLRGTVSPFMEPATTGSGCTNVIGRHTV